MLMDFFSELCLLRVLCFALSCYMCTIRNYLTATQICRVEATTRTTADTRYSFALHPCPCIPYIQAQLSQADTQSVHKHYEELLSGVRDKATFSSRQLSMAAMAADQSIRCVIYYSSTFIYMVCTIMYLHSHKCRVWCGTFTKEY